jgi:hypothetical protein
MKTAVCRGIPTIISMAKRALHSCSIAHMFLFSFLLVVKNQKYVIMYAFTFFVTGANAFSGCSTMSCCCCGISTTRQVYSNSPHTVAESFQNAFQASSCADGFQQFLAKATRGVFFQDGRQGITEFAQPAISR